jgi:hypothetical protein
MTRAKSKELTLRFEIKSLDPARPTVDAVPEIEKLSLELEAALGQLFPGISVKIRRAEGIPGLRELQELLLYVDWHAVKIGAETAIGTFATTEFLKLMKSKVRNVFAKRVPHRAAHPAVGEAPTSAKSVQQPKSPRRKPIRGIPKRSGGSKKKAGTSRGRGKK